MVTMLKAFHSIPFSSQIIENTYAVSFSKLFLLLYFFFFFCVYTWSVCGTLRLELTCEAQVMAAQTL